MNWLQVYHATPHTTTSTSLFKVFYGSKMHTKLDILPLLSARSPLDAFARHSVQRRQNKMPRYNHAKRGARKPSFRPGETVRIRNPHHVAKAHPGFTSPATVRKCIGPNSFLLSDGKVWNAINIIPLDSTVVVSYGFYY